MDKTLARPATRSANGTFRDVHSPVPFTEASLTRSNRDAHVLDIFRAWFICSRTPGVSAALYEMTMKRLISCNAILKRIASNDCERSLSRCDLKTNPLIVGPLRWSYQLLRPTIGERFMENPEACIFIDRSLIKMIALRTQTISIASCYH